MKIVNFIGGLGNQMFQYAFYLALRQRCEDDDMRIYTGAFNGYNVHVGYELERVYGICEKKATVNDLVRYAYPYINHKMWQIGNHLLPQRHCMLKEKIFGHYYDEAFSRPEICYFDGYWQNERYFKDLRQEILMAFTPIEVDERNRQMAMKLASCNSVSIHIRRGDYMKKKMYAGICGIDYYKDAIDSILQKTNVEAFCLFSNHTDWCKENILPLLEGKKVIVADWNDKENAYLDMYLMSHCHHNIIAHSSFSWWGAWLNQHPDKIVIGPKRWNNIRNSEFELPQSWLKI